MTDKKMKKNINKILKKHFGNNEQSIVDFNKELIVKDLCYLIFIIKPVFTLAALTNYFFTFSILFGLTSSIIERVHTHVFDTHGQLISLQFVVFMICEHEYISIVELAIPVNKDEALTNISYFFPAMIPEFFFGEQHGCCSNL